MSKKIEVNTNMDFLTYIRVVDSITSEFFDENGEYCPHIGNAYVMQLFYKQCVKSDDLEAQINNDMRDIDAINVLASNEKFMQVFNDSISPADYCFDFANAYRDAMEIVEDKKSSMARVTNMIEVVLREVVDRIMPVMTDDVLSAVKTVSTNMTGGKSTAEAIVDYYSKSDRFKEIINNVKTATDGKKPE